MEIGVFDRTETNDTIISASMYNFVIGVTLIWGFAINWLLVKNISAQAISEINPLMFFIEVWLSHQ